MADSPGTLYGYLIPGSGSCTRLLVLRDKPIAEGVELALLSGPEVEMALAEPDSPLLELKDRILAGIRVIDGVLRVDGNGFYPAITILSASYWDAVADRIRRFLFRLLELNNKDVHVIVLN